MPGGFIIKKLYELNTSLTSRAKIYAQGDTSSSDNGTIYIKNTILKDGNTLYFQGNYEGKYGLFHINLNTGETIKYREIGITNGQVDEMITTMWLQDGELRYCKAKISFTSISNLSAVNIYNFDGEEVAWVPLAVNLSTKSIYCYVKRGKYMYVVMGPYSAGYAEGTKKYVYAYPYYIRVNMDDMSYKVLCSSTITTYVETTTNITASTYGYGLQGGIAYSMTDYPDFRVYNPIYSLYLGGSFGTITAGYSYYIGGRGYVEDDIVIGEGLSNYDTYGIRKFSKTYIPQYYVNYGDDIYVYSVTNKSETTTDKHYQFSYSQKYEPKEITNYNYQLTNCSAPFWDSENNRYVVLADGGLYSIEFEQYDKILTINNSTGENIGQLTDLGAIDSISASITDGVSKITVTSPQTGTSTFTYEPTVPKGFKIIGYSFGKGGVVNVPLGDTITTNLTDGGSLYEVLGRDYTDTGLKFTFYKNTAENNRLDKTSYLTKISDIWGVLRNSTSITTPSFVIEYGQLPNFNYVYIPKFNRYYYVTNVTVIQNNIWKIDCSCDVLMSYKDNILNLTAHVDRNEQFRDPLIPDTERAISCGQEVYEFGFTVPTDRPNISISPSSVKSTDGYCMVVNGYRLTVKELS